MPVSTLGSGYKYRSHATLDGGVELAFVVQREKYDLESAQH